MCITSLPCPISHLLRLKQARPLPWRWLAVVLSNSLHLCRVPTRVISGAVDIFLGGDVLAAFCVTLGISPPCDGAPIVPTSSTLVITYPRLVCTLHSQGSQSRLGNFAFAGKGGTTAGSMPVQCINLDYFKFVGGMPNLPMLSRSVSKR